MPFGEYELSPSLIGLSLLHTPHPEAFQRLSVGASIPCYRDFTLDMCRSLGFASATMDSPRPLQARFHCGSRTSLPLTSPMTATRRFIMQKARRHTRNGAPTACRRRGSGSLSLPSAGCFSPFPHGTRTLSVSREYLALADGPAGFTQGSSCPALLRKARTLRGIRIRGSHPLRLSFPGHSPLPCIVHARPLQPRCGVATAAVWALPRSLATTGGITVVFSSWRY